MTKIQIFPSLLAADPLDIGGEISAFAAAQADGLHWDIMDGHFVPNLTFGPHIVAAARRQTTLFFDVHLMIQPVEPFLQAFLNAGANSITLHLEVADDIEVAVQSIHNAGARAGLAIKPGTDFEALSPWLARLDHVLVMTVEPGFGGQSFQPESIAKIASLRARCPKLTIQVDGGIQASVVPEVVRAGANTLIAGTAITAQGRIHYPERIQALRKAAEALSL